MPETAIPLTLTVIALLLAPATGRAEGGEDARSWWAGKLDLTSGFAYREGDYGRSEDTEIRAVPISLRYRFQELPLLPQRDEFRLRLSVPYLSVNGPNRGDASPGGVGQDEGMGNLNLRVSYVHRPKARWAPDIYVSEKVKFPTASEQKDLGSGEFDFTTALALRKRFRIRDARAFRYFKPFVKVGYKVAGEPPGERRENAFRVGVGASLAVTRSFDLGVRFYFRESTIPGRGSSQTFSPYASYRFSRWLRVSPYATFGVSERAPDWGAGFAVRLTSKLE